MGLQLFILHIEFPNKGPNGASISNLVYSFSFSFSSNFISFFLYIIYN